VKSLDLSHKIGSDWEPGPYQWMRFVALSADGTMAASNGALPGGARGMGLWTFPQGKFVRSVEGNPVQLSPDFRFLAPEDRVIELPANRVVYRLTNTYRIWTQAAFSPGGECFAFAAYLGNGKPDSPRITVVRTSDGSAVSHFGKRHTSALGGTCTASDSAPTGKYWRPGRTTGNCSSGTSPAARGCTRCGSDGGTYRTRHSVLRAGW